MKRLDAQRGFSLLEILAALAIGVLMMTSLTAMVDVSLADTKSQQVAKYQEQFTAAASRYLNDYAVNLYTQASAGTVPITRATLELKGYLPVGFALTNAYNQEPCLLVRQHVAPPGSPNGLDALVVTEKGTAILDKDLAYTAANAGTGGGVIDFGIPAQTAPIAHGNGWKLDNAALANFTNTSCSGTSAGIGHLASALFYGGPSGINKDVLYRNTTTDPLLNQMNIPLGFTANATKAINDTCTVPGITIETGTTNILTCNTGTGRWGSSSKYWKDPVIDYASLPPTPIDGEVHMTKNTGRAFMFSSASGTWLPLALDQFGTLNVPLNGDINVAGGKIAVTGDVTATGNMNANNINATTNVTALQGNVIAQVGNVIAQNGEVRSENGNVFARYALVGDSVSTSPKNAGDLCNYFGRLPSGVIVVFLSAGTVVTDSVGRIMECQPFGGPGSNGQFIYVDGTSTTPP